MECVIAVTPSGDFSKPQKLENDTRDVVQMCALPLRVVVCAWRRCLPLHSPHRLHTWLSGSYIKCAQPLTTRLHWPIKPSSKLIHDPSSRDKGCSKENPDPPWTATDMDLSLGKTDHLRRENYVLWNTDREGKKEDILAPCTLLAK